MMRANATASPAGAQWSPLIPVSIVPAAAAGLPNGKVLLWSSYDRFAFGGTGQTYTVLFDPLTQLGTEALVTQTGHDMFCPGTTNLSDGSILVNGGENGTKTSIYNPSTNTWSSGALMNIGRGYEGNTLLEDGSIFTLGGSWGGGAAAAGGRNAELWTAAGGWKLLTGVPVDPAIGNDPAGVYRGDNHMWLFTAPNSQVLQAGPSAAMNWIDTTGNGHIMPAGNRGDDVYSQNGNAVMYDVGKILKLGGGPAYDTGAATASTYAIDINAGVTVRKLAPMAYPRVFANSVVLPNGQVLVVGGQTFSKLFSDDNSVLVPELWDPTTETFSTLPPIAVGRNYHSVALLLPDGRVMSGGGGLCGAGCVANHADVQILTPHYLLNADGTSATRPVINTAPLTATRGTSVAVTTDSPIASFALLRVGSSTHTVNNDQRRIPLQFSSTGTNAYALSLPTNPSVLLPGYYMLFAINANGVPSVSKMVQVTTSGAPKLTNPGTQATVSGTAAQLTLNAVPASGSLAFSATGLPPGLQINAATGAVTGTATTAGLYRVTVSAQDAVATTSTQFQWNIVALDVPVQYARLEAVTEINGNPWTSMAEFNLLDTNGALISRAGWTVTADSAELVGENAPPTNAIDGDASTIWHTQYQGGAPYPPHIFTVNLGAARNVGGFKYLPRPGGGNGTIAGWRFYTSTDGAAWTLVAQGSFANSATEKIVYPFGNAATTNQPPALSAVANQSNTVGQSVSLALAATDPDGDTLSYSATGLPAGATINAATGLISGTLTTAGTYNVTALVSDGRGGSASRAFVWTVAAVGGGGGSVQYVRLEAISEVNGNPWTSMAEFNVLDGSGVLISRTGWTVAADSVELVGENAPASNAIDGNASTIWHTQWKTASPPPPHTFTVNMGATHTVGGFKYLPRPAGNTGGNIAGWRFYTSPDGAVWTLVGQGTFANTSTEKIVYPFGSASTNQAPTLSAVANQSGSVGQSVSLALAATDPDGDTLSYSASGLPAGATINAATGVISGTLSTAGTYNVTAQVSDGRGGSASRSFVWTVAAAATNQSPTLNAVANQGNSVGQSVSLALTAADPDGDTLSYSATGLPAGTTINATSGVISGTFTTAGTYNVSAQVSDGRGGSASRAFVWTVGAAGSGGGTVQYVRLQAVSEVNGNPWTSMAEFNVLDSNGAILPRTGWVASADSVELVGENAPASNAIDGDASTIWHTQWKTASPLPPHTLTVNMGAAQAVGGFKYLPRPAGNTGGNIAGWRFYTSADGVAWTLVGQGTFANTSAEKIIYPFGSAVVDQPPTLSAVANQSNTVGQSVSLALAGSDPDGDALSYSASGLPAGATINAATGLISGTLTTSGTYNVTAQVSDGRGGSASRSFVWTVAVVSSGGGTVQYVRLEAISEVNGNPWTSMAEFNVLNTSGTVVSRAGWTVSADSAELVGENAPASNAIDGSASTFWHTQWQGGSTPLPHTFTVNMGSGVAVGGFKYLPRPAGNTNGTIAGWRFYTSTDGVAWALVGQGTFANTSAEKTVTLP